LTLADCTAAVLLVQFLFYLAFVSGVNSGWRAFEDIWTGLLQARSPSCCPTNHVKVQPERQ